MLQVVLVYSSCEHSALISMISFYAKNLTEWGSVTLVIFGERLKKNMHFRLIGKFGGELNLKFMQKIPGSQFLHEYGNFKINKI